MEEKNYVAYVGTYTHGSSKGIYIYDLDVENGQAKERKVVPINNPSYIKKPTTGNTCIPLLMKESVLFGFFQTETLNR